jgi:hypothetical protein
MAITATSITATAVSSGTPNGTAVYTSNGNNAITSMIACNNSGSSITISVYAVPNGKNAYNNPETTIISNLVLPAGETLSLDQEKLVLGNNDIIAATASVTYTGTGVGVIISTLPV